MKKAIVIISLVLCTAHCVSIKSKTPHLLFGGDYLYGENSDDQEEDRTSFQYILNASYFLNLHSNYGNNQTKSTCGYVALAMLLRYYDYYTNNSIVDDDYEVAGSSTNSPGTLHEPNCSSLTTNPDSVAAYYTYIRGYKDTSLHSYLILKDKDALLNNPPVSNMASTYKEEFGTDEHTLMLLAQSYLYDLGINQYCTMVYNTSYMTSYTVDDISDEIVYELQQGRPVLAGYNHHAKIVFGYSNGITRHFHVHQGDDHFIDDECAPREGDLDSDGHPITLGYLSLHFNFHVHSYTDHYVYHNVVYHKAYCSCGSYTLKKHSFITNPLNDPCPCGATS